MPETNSVPNFTISEVRENKRAWEKRHWNPAIKMAWNSAIKVIPAANGGAGIRIYPDGKEEVFHVAY